MSLETAQHFIDVAKVNAVSWGSLAFANALSHFVMINEMVQTAASTVIVVATAIYSVVKLIRAFKKRGSQ